MSGGTPAAASLLRLLGWLAVCGAGLVVALTLGGAGAVAQIPTAAALLVTGAALIGAAKAIDLLASIDQRLAKLDESE